jgi:hypothetical protein
MRIARTSMAALAAVSLLLAACIPEFAAPIGGGEPADPAVIGKWNAAPKGDPSDVMILDIKTEAGGIVLTMSPAEESAETPVVLKGRTGQGPGGTKFVSLQPQGDDMGGNVGFFVFRYEPDGADIKVWSLDPSKLREAVDAGKLAGTASGQGTDTSVKITASGDAAAAFLESAEGQAMFMTGDEDVLILKKTAP